MISKGGVPNSVCEDYACEMYSYARRCCNVKKIANLETFDYLIKEGVAPTDCPRVRRLQIDRLKEQRRQKQ